MDRFRPSSDAHTKLNDLKEDQGDAGGGEGDPRIEFLRQVCEDPKVLETLSGVERLVAAVDLDLCVESDEDF